MEKQVSKSRFERAALAYLLEVETTGKALVITDQGCPVLRVGRTVPAAETLGRLRGCVLRYDRPADPVEIEWG